MKSIAINKLIRCKQQSYCVWNKLQIGSFKYVQDSILGVVYFCKFFM